MSDIFLILLFQTIIWQKCMYIIYVFIIQYSLFLKQLIIYLNVTAKFSATVIGFQNLDTWTS